MMADSCRKEKTYLCNGQSSHKLSSQSACPLQFLHLRTGGSMFTRTGSEGNDAEHKVPMIRCIVEFS